MVQSMPDASPAKWHLAHTTWFFEEFVLAPFDPSHRWDDERWRVLFNSYYEGVGPQHTRSARGLLSRPSLAEVRAWRRSVDDRMAALLARADDAALAVTLLGTHHEEQHQELILADIKHALWSNPIHPPYTSDAPTDRASDAAASLPLVWTAFDEALVDIGADGAAFAFDNETPRHRGLVEGFSLASRPVTNAEYAAFIADGGYEKTGLWLSDGWAAVQAGRWRAPLYWDADDGSPRERRVFGLRGWRPIEPEAPVCHVSFFEADAYARWAEARLPTENEWEAAAQGRPVDGNFVESGRWSPAPAMGPGVAQLFGDVWEWTASDFAPYPGFVAFPYRDYSEVHFGRGYKVLRGGSWATRPIAIRNSFRNWDLPQRRQIFAGFRCAADA